MGLEQVLQEVQARAAQERTRLEAEASSARQDALKAAQGAVEDHRKKALERASRDIVRLKTQEAASTELELKREELQMERELIERTLRTAQERLRALPRERNEAALRHLLDRYEREGTHVLTVPKDDLFVKMATSLTHGGHVDASGGVVVTNTEGSVRLDLTFDTLMRDLSERKLKEIHEKLFGGSK
jgi:V/A-type H+-transporting ATPase subunit E